MATRCLSFIDFDAQDHILFAATTDEGEPIEDGIVRHLFDMPCRNTGNSVAIENSRLEGALVAREKAVTDTLKRQYVDRFSAESQKLER